MISKRRIVRSPRFETAPSFCLPPVDFCSGVSPSQAAKSRPAANPSAAGTNAVIAVEAIGPTPGIVISRRAVGSALERRLISASSSAICPSSAVVQQASRRRASKGSWLAQMLARKPKMLVTVALANKMARIVWALLVKGGAYRAPVVAA